MNKSKQLGKRNRRDMAILFLPAMLCIAAVVVFPLAYSLILSFTDTNLRSQGLGDFVGLKNYITALTDECFRKSIFTTLKYTVVSVVFELCIGYLIAALLNLSLIHILYAPRCARAPRSSGCAPTYRSRCCRPLRWETVTTIFRCCNSPALVWLWEMPPPRSRNRRIW